MTHQGIVDFSKETIQSVFAEAGIPIGIIYLFGSRYRGDATADSDWDFLVISKNEIPFPQKALIIGKVQTRLAEKLISADLIIKSEKKISEERNNVGVVTCYALKDGVMV